MINDNLEAQVKILYDYWFNQFEFPNEDGKPYKSSGGKMVWNQNTKRYIPESWSIEPLRGKYDIKRGISYSSKDIESGIGIPMINLACINVDRNYRDGELKYYNGANSEAHVVSSGDLLIATTDLTRNADIIGCPIVVPFDDNSYIYSMDLAKLNVCDQRLNKWYLYSSLRTDTYHNYIKKWASGTNVLHLNLDGMNWYDLVVPDKHTQEKYAKFVKYACAKQGKLLNENRKLTTLRDFLLPLLMNGQITIE